MKNHAQILLLLFLGLPWAVARAQQAPEVPTPPFRIGPLRFEEISFSKGAGQCQNGPCMTASIDYLKVVSAENAQAAAKLTAALAEWVLRMDNGKVAKNPEEWLQWWVDREWKIRQEVMEPPDSPSWHEIVKVDIEYNSPQVLSLSCLRSGYYGGAHGAEGLIYANFRPATGESIRLTDIFKEGFAAALNAVGERCFRESEGLSPRASLKEGGFNFPDDRFQLNENFAIGGDGLTFYYNTQEISSTHAAGPTKLLLPYADVQNLLRPDARIP